MDNIHDHYRRAVADMATDADLAEMRALWPTPLSADDRIVLGFALGHVLAERRDPAAFDYLAVANTMQRRRVTHDEWQAFDQMRRIVTLEPQSLGPSSPAPAFVVGMPRSGTSLVEQILASHPQVHGAGEITDFRDLAFAERAFPEGPITALQAERLGATYLRRLDIIAPSAARVVNKLPQNFLLIGLIRAALPGARIIHVHRDPLDTCWSCYTKYFEARLPFTYELGELGRYYAAYERMMSAWREKLPGDAFLDVRYEDVVADIKTEARRMIDFLDLPWSPACLAPHLTERTVTTASVWQVRRPLFADSIGRSAPYLTNLGPLTQALGYRTPLRAVA